MTPLTGLMIAVTRLLRLFADQSTRGAAGRWPLAGVCAGGVVAPGAVPLPLPLPGS